ncbi:hypothetical protein J6590_039742 [Homalodisca vitripennis]|nr:hypothetical protein J6590_039742 [Homalodisca vitripennis]
MEGLSWLYSLVKRSESTNNKYDISVRNVSLTEKQKRQSFSESNVTTVVKHPSSYSTHRHRRGGRPRLATGNAICKAQTASGRVTHSLPGLAKRYYLCLA